MNQILDRCLLLSCLLGALATCAFAQKPSGGGGAAQAGQQGGQSGQAAQSGGSSAGLQGLTYSPDEWPNLRLPDVKSPNWTFKEGRTVLCYRLVKGNSASQPFVLEPLSKFELRGTGFFRPCGDNSRGETDSEGQKACKRQAAESKNLGSDATHWTPCSELENLKSPILMNQVLVIGVDVSDLGEMGINIDQLKLLNINVTNQQGAAINPSPIRPSFPNTSASGGGGGSAGLLGTAANSYGKGDWWIPLGKSVPAGAYPRPWKEKIIYNKGDVVIDPAGNFHMANQRFSTPSKKPSDPFPPEPRAERIGDGEVIWQEMDPPAEGAEAFLWQANYDSYKKDSIVCVVRDLQYPQPAPAPAPAETFREQMAELSAHSPNNHLVAKLSANPVLFANQPQSVDDSQDPEAPPKQKACKDVELDSKKKQKLHYYLAIQGGSSGSIPDDPFSIIMIPRAIYLAWPYELQGDLVPTFNVNLVYTPPMPGAPWQGNTFYPAGSVVTSSRNQSSVSPTTGHYYTALTGGFSSPEPGEPYFPGDVPPTYNDGNLVWLDAGTTAPSTTATPGAGSAQSGGGGGQGAGGQGTGGGQAAGAGGGGAGKSQIWFPQTHYLLGDVILNPDNGHYYTVVKLTGGFSGPKPSSQPNQQATGKAPAADPFPTTPGQTQILTDGQIQWELQTSTPAPPVQQWSANQPFSIGQAMKALNKQYYVMIASMATSGTSAAEPSYPPFPTVPVVGTQITDNQITWKFVPGGVAQQGWKPNTLYSPRDYVYVGPYVYQMASTVAGNSGPAPSYPFVTAPSLSTRVRDSQIFWMLAPNGSAQQGWQPNTQYSVGQYVYGGPNIYVMVGSPTGNTGGTDPTAQTGLAPLVTVSDGDLLWGDIGVSSTPPAHPLWAPNNNYSLGDPVSASNGHDYRVVRFVSGTSGPPPQSPFPSPTPGNSPTTRVADGTILWAADSSAPNGVWTPNTPYGKGFVVYPPEDTSQSQRWKAMNTGTSGIVPIRPVFPALQSNLVIEPSTDPIEDGTIFWADRGVVRPITLAAGNQKPWKPGSHGGNYDAGDLIFVQRPGGGRYYEALNNGSTGEASPFANVSQVLPLTWQDSGTTAPASVATGQPADQTVSLINLTLPQSHSLSYFNIAAGVLIDFKQPPLFSFVSASTYVSQYHGTLPSGYVPATGTVSITPANQANFAVDPSTGCTVSAPQVTPSPTPNTNLAYQCPVQTAKGPHPVDPVLLLTLYAPPVDAERKMSFTRPRDYIPGASFGLSLSNPTTNVYVGASNEFLLRDVQIFYGLGLHNAGASLGPGSTQPLYGGQGTVPAAATLSKFQKGFSLGVTFNLSGFIQTLIGGGGGAAK